MRLTGETFDSTGDAPDIPMRMPFTYTHQASASAGGVNVNAHASTRQSV